MLSVHTAWLPEHFIGGHPALDLCNAVYDRRTPIADNELLKSVRDIANWFRASELADDRQAEAVAGISDRHFLEAVHEVRDASFQVFDAIASNKEPSATVLGSLFSRAAIGLAAQPFALHTTRPRLTLSQWKNPKVVIGLLAVLSIEAFFTLPRERLHACPRCGWLFIDKSRGGKRRWCDMRTCGNREKVSRHRKGRGG